MLKKVFGSCIISLFFLTATAQTWNGAGDGVSWGDMNNWNPVGVPTPASNVTIVTAGAFITANGPVLITSLTFSVSTVSASPTLSVNGNFSTTGLFVMDNSVLDVHGNVNINISVGTANIVNNNSIIKLNGNTCEVTTTGSTGFNIYNNSWIENGTFRAVMNGLGFYMGNTTFPSTCRSYITNAYISNTFTNCTMNGPVYYEYSGNSFFGCIVTSGTCTFNDTLSIVSYAPNWGGPFIEGNLTVNGPAFITNNSTYPGFLGGQQLILGSSSDVITFNNSAVLTNSGTGADMIRIADGGSSNKVTFNGPTTLVNEGDIRGKRFDIARFASVSNNSVVFNNLLTFHSDTYSIPIPYNGASGFFLGSTVTTNSVTLGANASVLVSAADYNSDTLYFRRVRQLGSGPVTIGFSSAANNGVVVSNQCNWGGATYFSVPAVNILTSNFNGSSNDIVTTAVTLSSFSSGANNFAGPTTFIHNGLLPFYFDNTNTSVGTYSNTVTFAGTGTVYPNYLGNSVFQGNLNINTNSFTTFGAGATGSRKTIFKGANTHSITVFSPIIPLLNYVEVNKSANVLTLASPISIGQKLTLTNGVFNLDTTLIMLNPSTTAITGGSPATYLKSEDTDNSGRLQWNIGANAGTYTFPWGYQDPGNSTHYYIPEIFTITAAGVGTGTLSVATYHTDPTATPNNRPLPLTVANINRNGAENADHVVDRFWQNDATGYTTNPTIDVLYTYSPQELIGTNSITETNLQAQRWDNSTQKWDAPVGIVDVASKTVATYSISSFSPWTLVDNAFTLLCGTLPTIITNPNSMICYGADITLLADGAGTGGAYTWLPETGLNTTTGYLVIASPTVTTTYTVTGTSTVNIGCKSTKSLLLTVGTEIVTLSSGDASICEGSSTLLTVSGGSTFTWSPPTGLSDHVGTVVVANPTVTTTYTTTGVSASCTDFDVLTITVNPLPIVTLSPANPTICAGIPTALQASGSSLLSYTWTPPTALNQATGTDVITNPTATITYTVTGTDINNCSSRAPLLIIVDQIPIANAGNDVSICTGNSATLIATGGDNYLWDTGIASSNISVSPALSTIYTVTVSIGNCTDVDFVEVTTNEFPIASAGEDVAIDHGASTTLLATGGTTYLWSPENDIDCATCQNPTVKPLVSTTYTVMVTSAAGCASYDSVRVTVNIECGELFVPSAFSPNNDGENDVLLLQRKGSCDKEEIIFKIFDRWGNAVFESSDPLIGWDGTAGHNNRKVADGVYVYTATITDKKLVTRKQGNISLIR